jgi:DNA-binding CsgD family transcriptional regulator
VKNPQLSQREREILTRLAEGDSNKQIACACNITESTVKVHLIAILRKITAHNRMQSAVLAWRPSGSPDSLTRYGTKSSSVAAAMSALTCSWAAALASLVRWIESIKS